MESKINELYKDYEDGKVKRRDFIKKLAVLTGSTAIAASLLPLLEEHGLQAATVLQEEITLHNEMVSYPGETGEVKAFLARPEEDTKYPAVIVIHENRGLVPHIKDVNRRMAKEGFLSVAPDALSPMGGTPEDESKAGSMMRELDSEKTVKNFAAAVKYLKTHPNSNGKVGCTGFCWGGAMTNSVAVLSPDLDAAVPYYGRQPSAEDVAKIKAPVLAHYGGNDERINAGIPAFEAALKEANIEYEIYIYERAGHAFNNDSNPDRYHEEAAKLAWERTIAFFKEKLES